MFFVQINHTGKGFLFLIFREIKLRKYSSLHKLFYGLESYDHTQLKRHLQQHNNNLIFTTQDDVTDYENVTFYPLLHGQFNLLIPETYSNLVNKQQIKCSDLQNQSFILMDNNWCPPQQLRIQEKIRNTIPNLDITYVNNVEVAFTMVQAGLGITIMPNFIAGNILKDAVSIPLANSVQLTYGIALLNDSKDATAVSFAKYAVKYISHSFN